MKNQKTNSTEEIKRVTPDEVIKRREQLNLLAKKAEVLTRSDGVMDAKQARDAVTEFINNHKKDLRYR